MGYLGLVTTSLVLTWLINGIVVFGFNRGNKLLLFQMEQVLNKGNRVKGGDNQPIKQLSILTLCIYNQLRRDFKMRNNVSEPGLTLLLHLTDSYKFKGHGLTVSAIAKYYSPYDNGKREITSVQNKVNTLLNNNLIEVMGYGRYNANMYIPTQRVLRELQEMCDKINEG
jgi:hypothetical protein